MTKTPTMLDQAFDHLSTFPYLNMRKILKAMWVFSTVFFGYAILIEGLEIFKGNLEFRTEWIQNLVIWAGVNPFFAKILYLWGQRDNENKSSEL